MDLTYLPIATEGHMMPTKEVLELWADVKARTDFKHIFEIGTNAGHSSAMILTLFPDVKVTSIDIGAHKYTSYSLTNKPAFYLALAVMVIGVQMFLAGFVAELVSRNAGDRNSLS